MLKESQLVAVYGSLKRGFGNYHCMERANGEFVSTAKTEDANFIMEGSGFPYVVRNNSEMGGKVAVELFKVNKAGVLNDLDSLEGHPTFYKRELMFFEKPDGIVVEAWLYIYQDYIGGDESLRDYEGTYVWKEDW